MKLPSQAAMALVAAAARKLEEEGLLYFFAAYDAESHYVSHADDFEDRRKLETMLRHVSRKVAGMKPWKLTEDADG